MRLRLLTTLLIGTAGYLLYDYVYQSPVYRDKTLLDMPYKGPSHELSKDLRGFTVRITQVNSKGETILSCSAVIIDDHYALTAGHCAEKEGRLIKAAYSVFDDKGAYVTTAKAAAYSYNPDLGIIRGDFSSFNQLDTVYKDAFIDVVTKNLVVCGYPHGSAVLFCEHFILAGIQEFSIVGTTVVTPGMSGGPVIDTSLGKVVGIITASGYSTPNAYASILIGFDAAFLIENKEF